MYSFSIGQEHEKMYTSTNNSCFPVQPYVKIDTVLFNILSTQFKQNSIP